MTRQNTHLDCSGLKTYSIHDRSSLVSHKNFARPWDRGKDFRSFLDTLPAILAGNDIRTGLICFGTDGTHGYERTHVSALEGVARLVTSYMRSQPVVPRDRKALGSVEGFPTQPVEEAPHRSSAKRDS